MAWTTPKTWAFQEGVESSELNVHMRDNFLAMGPHLIARKTADQSVTSSGVLQSDTALLTPSIPANEIWTLELLFPITGPVGVGQGIVYSFQQPTGSQISWLGYGVDAPATTFTHHRQQTVSDNQTGSFLSDTVPRLYRVTALFTNGGTAGAVTFRWAQNTSNGTAVVVKANSTLWGVKLA